MQELKNMDKIILETNRLILRPITMDDAFSMYQNWASDPEVAKYLSWEPHPNLDETKRVINYWLKRYQDDPYFFHWVIIFKKSLQPIGTIDIFNVDERFHYGEIGYCLSRAYWNQQIMTEAVFAIMQYAFEENNFVKIISKHFLENVASGKVMMHAGMKFVKYTTIQKCKPDQSGMLACYQITSEEWRNFLREKNSE